METERLKECFIPSCRNNSMNSPKKVFVRIREDLKRSWCRQVNAECFKIFAMYCCEDHLNLKKDLKNYDKWKQMGGEPLLEPHAELRNISSAISETDINTKSYAPGSQSFTSTTKKPIASGDSELLKLLLAPVEKIAKPTSGPPLNGSASDSETSDVSEDDQGTSRDPKIYPVRKNMLDLINKKPEMYLGLPSKFFWLLDYVISKSRVKPTYLCLVVTLFTIKQNDSVDRMIDQFELSGDILKSMFAKGVKVLVDFFKCFVFMPPASQIRKNLKNLPVTFTVHYPKAQMIVNCLEIEIEKPRDRVARVQTWSVFKNCYTMKYLVGFTPNGFVNFISAGYGGGISDRALVIESQLIDVLPPNAVIIESSGFKVVESLLKPKGIKVLQLLTDRKPTHLITQLIAHTEKVLRRMTEFRILRSQSVINSEVVMYLDEIVTIACGLINLQDEVEKK